MSLFFIIVENDRCKKVFVVRKIRVLFIVGFFEFEIGVCIYLLICKVNIRNWYKFIN